MMLSAIRLLTKVEKGLLSGTSWNCCTSGAVVPCGGWGAPARAGPASRPRVTRAVRVATPARSQPARYTYGRFISSILSCFDAGSAAPLMGSGRGGLISPPRRLIGCCDHSAGRGAIHECWHSCRRGAVLNFHQTKEGEPSLAPPLLAVRCCLIPRG